MTLLNQAATIAATAAATLLTAAPAMAIDEAHYRKGREMADSAMRYLRAQQDEATGGWNIMPEGRPQLPAITGIVLHGLLLEPDVDANDPAVARGLDFVLKYRQDDGGIYDQMLSNYSTSICLSALARVHRPDVADAIKPAQDFIRGVQWSGDAIAHGETRNVDEDHPFYGGWGYGNKSRPDMSNTQIALQALHDSGLDCNDVAFTRALTFLQRCQMDDQTNDMRYADGSTQGGFIYATAKTGAPQHVGKGETKGVPETVNERVDGEEKERLRTYGSVTYAGFKSYIYANLDRDDRRVQLALDWIKDNYTLKENPGTGDQGTYYYFVTFARTLDAWGLPQLQVVGEDGSIEPRDWANDLIDRLEELQEPDGSFRSVHDRWMEDNKVLITAYALLALQHATR